MNQEMMMKEKLEMILHYAQLMREQGAQVDDFSQELSAQLEQMLGKAKALTGDKALALKEPDDLDGIRALRPDGPRRMIKGLPEGFEDKLRGALITRIAGCTLGTLVESWSIVDMQEWARYCTDPFPPTRYPSAADHPQEIRYGLPRERNALPRMAGAPPDDDTTYTFLGLLIAEQYGLDFSTADVGAAWQRFLPVACTAEKVALENLAAGVPIEEVGVKDNPYVQWIGADIRCDPWAYMAPGWPEKAAELAYRDAMLSHRRNGVYGAMYFAAAQAAAFCTKDIRQALEIGLSEIPRDCLLAQDIRWALAEAANVRDYQRARELVDARFPTLDPVHTRNNACLTVFGLLMGDGDVSRTLSQIVAMGLDNDCTAATAGSIVGAVAGFMDVPVHWYAPFAGIAHSYITGYPSFEIEDLVVRFAAQADKLCR